MRKHLTIEAETDYERHLLHSIDRLVDIAREWPGETPDTDDDVPFGDPAWIATCDLAAVLAERLLQIGGIQIPARDVVGSMLVGGSFAETVLDLLSQS